MEKCFDRKEVPEVILERVQGKKYTANGIGLSDSEVLMFDDSVLKIQKRSRATDNEREMLAWLEGRIPAARLLAYAEAGDTAYTLMSRVEGRMLCAPEVMRNPRKLVRLAAEGIAILRGVDIGGCPCRFSRLEEQLRMARENVENGRVDMEDAEPETRARFSAPADLLEWLEKNRPEEDTVLIHGDYSLPNVLTDGERITGFIDLSRSGPADGWADLALLARSLEANYSGRYAPEKKYTGYREEMLWEALGIAPDPEKRQYYLLLDELF